MKITMTVEKPYKPTAKELRFQKSLESLNSPEVTDLYIRNIEKRGQREIREHKRKIVTNSFILALLFVPSLIFGSFFYLLFKAYTDFTRKDASS